MTKPNTTRRAYATTLAVWGDIVDRLLISAPNYDLYDLSPLMKPDAVIAELVGDIERIINYPELGFQIPQDIPDNVMDAYHRLKRVNDF